GGRNRTDETCLEGRSFTTKLRPRWRPRTLPPDRGAVKRGYSPEGAPPHGRLTRSDQRRCFTARGVAATGGVTGRGHFLYDKTSDTRLDTNPTNPSVDDFIPFPAP
ncbi:MAG: hypothetical protein RL479_1243, partial [Verrucomicrobiota bacterium]